MTKYSFLGKLSLHAALEKIVSLFTLSQFNADSIQFNKIDYKAKDVLTSDRVVLVKFSLAYFSFFFYRCILKF